MARINRGVIPLWAAVLAVCAATAPCARAGTLALGPPVVNGSQFVFPIELRTDGGQVSALDFRVQFDPQVFQPLAAEAGNAALAANKMVSANYAAPGEYVVVMMGLNQTPVSSGHVATVSLERIGTEELVSSQVTIVNPTLASPDGAELPASGSTVSVPLGGKAPSEGENGAEEGESGGSEPDPTTPDPNKPEPTPSPATPSTPAATPGATSAPGTQGMLAGLPLGGRDPGIPQPPSGANGSETPEKKGGLQMPIVLGSETPEAGSAARQAAAGASNSPTARVSMSSVDSQESLDGTTDATEAAVDKIESTRKENTPAPIADASGGGGESPEGEATGMTLAFAGTILALLIVAAALLKKFSNR